MNELAPLLRIAWLLAVWKFNARIKRAFTAKSEKAVPAHRTNTNIWTVVTHSTIPTDVSCPIGVTEERSQAQVPAESKNRCSSINQALPSIAVGDHTGLAFMFWCPQQQRSLFFDVRRPGAQRHLGVDQGFCFFWSSKEICPPGRYGRAFPGNRGRQGSLGGVAFRMLIIILVLQGKTKIICCSLF